ncbi:MAG: hypothetical protein NWR36_08140 [Opitutales bacterium]|nr:hypothetical protein [Opitutales bacterium]
MAADVESSGQRHVKESHRFLSPVLSVALMVGIAVHLAGFLIFRVVSNPLPTRDDRAAFVRYVSAGSLAGDLALEEQAQLFDSAPLFVPTQWNAAQNVSLAQRDRVRERFPEFEPAIDLLKALDNSDALIGSVDSVQQPKKTKSKEQLPSRHGFGSFSSALANRTMRFRHLPTWDILQRLRLWGRRHRAR